MKIDEDHHFKMYETPISRLFVDHPLSSECMSVLLFFVHCFFFGERILLWEQFSGKSKAKGKHHPPMPLPPRPFLKVD